MTLVSDIKLIRTDTTLDLSQKAEKGILPKFIGHFMYMECPIPFSLDSWALLKVAVFGGRWDALLRL
ncbi:hypothetical protein MPTK1_5g20270 [Marchantia polymorpha subsp. ruderalis]|uniref:Uncharacterized protein n=2 Tax=Marchantia polymorpha TaxID=3197 RepID=A0AAF6BKC6_MARPO|nr:hypothetical protein MARPO_0058s0004 [Marchantia polymorpha]BBN12460.1 hypothetical protein Mp_5g20270 [Marchantia polymorpha subsp. ruderalis]|eukprot:PTQ37212.1 hypothetical protein MARPO_0058s0004 [Marchantia polymorpha]